MATETKTIRLSGKEAIAYAEANELTLSKYNDPTEDAREDVEIADARRIAREDPNLIYIDVEPARYQVRTLGEPTSVAGREYEYSLGLLLCSTDDAKRAIRIAEGQASGWSRGTAIVDTVARTVDVGDEIVMASRVYGAEV